MTRRSRKGWLYFRIAAALLGVLLVADIILASAANQRIRHANYFFEEHLRQADLGPEPSKLIDCVYGTELVIYRYATCFWRVTPRGHDKWLYEFHYARPYPVLLGGRDIDSYRFKMIAAGAPLRRVAHDGTVEKVLK